MRLTGLWPGAAAAAGCTVCGQHGCAHKRCPAYTGGEGQRLSCCRPELHDGPHCGHPLVSGTPGCVGPGGRSRCTGGALFTTTELLSPTEAYYRDRRPVRPRTPPTGGTP